MHALPPTSGAAPLLSRGMTGPEVTHLQEFLNARGFPCGIDGDFGIRTESAVRAFQRSIGIDPDGIAGPETFGGLESPGPAAPTTPATPTPPRTTEGGDPVAMQRLLAWADAHNTGGSRGRCYEYVYKYLQGAHIGAFAPGVDPVPQAYWAEARMFAEYANQGNHAAELGLARLDLTNPYDAPPGAIVVVAAGSPGTHHPTAGDIAIAAGNGRFVNDGPNMAYGPRESFEANGGRVLGVYVPV